MEINWEKIKRRTEIQSNSQEFNCQKSFDDYYDRYPKEWLTCMSLTLSGVDERTFWGDFNHLPNLPKGLVHLYIIKNKFKKLPTLPNKIEEIYCASNLLKCLPLLPRLLNVLFCGHNKLRKIPPLPKCNKFKSWKVYNNFVNKYLQTGKENWKYYRRYKYSFNYSRMKMKLILILLNNKNVCILI